MTRRVWPALLLAFVVFAAFPAGAQASPATRALDYLHAKQLSSGGFGTGATADAQITPWAIMAISAAGDGPQKSRWNRGGKDPVDYLQGLDLEVAAGSSSTVVNRPAFYAKVMLAYIAAGRLDLIWSAGTKGISLPDKLRSYQYAATGAFFPSQPGANPPTNMYATVNTTIWAIISLKAAGETDGNVEAAIAWLVAEQNGNGGFGSQPSAPSDVDDTAAAVMALRAPFANRDGMSALNPVIVDALAYLGSAQRSDGGFPSMATDGRSYTESTAWATQAIVACGQKPSSWKKGSNTPLSFLRSMQRRSGLFAHRAGAVSTPLMTTTQAVIALSLKPFPFGLPNDPKNRAFLPHFDSFSPGGNPTFKTSTVYVKATYGDNVGGTGIRVGPVRITVDGVVKTKAATITASSLALKLTGLRNGSHKVVIRLADWAGNSVSRTRTFTVNVPVPAPTPSATPTYRPPTTPTTPTTPTYPGGSGTVPGALATPTPAGSVTPGATTDGSGTVTGTPFESSPSASPGAAVIPSGASPSPGATAGDQSGDSSLAGWVAVGLVALLPLGALASFLGHRRQEAALGGAGSGRELLGGGTPWERFRARVLGVSSVMSLKR